MTVFEREAMIRWLTGPPGGVPRMTVGSGSLRAVPLNVDLDAEHPLATSPGELLAGAIGATFAWLAAQELLRAGTPAREFTVEAALSVSGDADRVDAVALRAIACKLAARVPQIDQPRLEEVAKLAISKCVETLALRGERLRVTVEAVLE